MWSPDLVIGPTIRVLVRVQFLLQVEVLIWVRVRIAVRVGVRIWFRTTGIGILVQIRVPCRSPGSPPAIWMVCSGLTTSTGSVISRTSSPYELYSLILRAAAHVISTFRSAFTDRPDGSSSTGHRVAGTRCWSSSKGHRVSPKQHRVLDTVSWRSARDTGR